MNDKHDNSLGAQETDVDVDVDELWRLFTSQYPTNEACLKAIVKRLREAGARCPGCGATDFKVKNHRKCRCRRCGDRFSITAGTFFDHMKTPMAWYAAIWLMERGVLVNAVDFSKKVMIAQSSARSILQRVMAVIVGCRDERLIQSGSGDFMRLFVRRSAETVAREHPRSEEEAIRNKCEQTRKEQASESVTATRNSEGSELGRPNEPRAATELAQAIGSELPDEVAAILKLLTMTPKSISELCRESGLPTISVQMSMTMLELEGFCKRLPGGTFMGADAAESVEKREIDSITDLGYACDPGARAAQRKAIEFIVSTFRGISRKYLQLYLGAHWCFVDRKRWCEGAILDACLAHRPLREKDVFAMVTPPSVRFASAAAL